MVENNSTYGGRRKALKLIGAGTIAMAGPMIGSTVASSDETVVISIQRNQDNGIDANEYSKLVSRFSEAAIEKAGLERLVVADPELSAGEKIYSLTFVATPDGNAQTYIGSGTNPGDAEVERLHDRSDQFQEQNTVESTGDSLSPQQSDPSYEWNQVGSALWESTNNPYGIVQNSSDVWHYPDDPNFDVFAVTTDAVFNPGASAYDSSYVWDAASARNYWGRHYEPTGATLTEWAPNGDRTGDTTVSASISYSGASIEVSYNPPEVRRTDNTGLKNDNVRIIWKPGDTTTDEDILSTSVASTIKSENYASVGDTLAQTDCRYTVNGRDGDRNLSSNFFLEYQQ